MPKRRNTSKTNPEDTNRPRELVRVLCGWCATNDHQRCKRELLWYEKHYVCKCECADEFYATLDKKQEVSHTSDTEE